MKTKKVIMNIAFALLICLIVFFATFALLAIKFRIKYSANIVQQYSMVPTINKSLYLNNPDYIFDDTKTGDLAYVNKKAKFGLGDVVIANIKGEPDPVIKRVVGMPGDKIRIVKQQLENEISYTLLVNEEPLYTKPEKEYIGKNKYGEEVYLNNSVSYEAYINFFSETKFSKNFHRSESVYIENTEDSYIILNENECFLMGDNWNSSKDSLTFGAIKTDAVTGKVSYIVDNYANKFWAVIKLMFKDVFNGTKKSTLEFIR